MLIAAALYLAVAGVSLAQDVPSPTPSPAARQSLDDAWWTGPLLAPGAGTLPRGHVLVEPYFYDVIHYGNYDRHGAVTAAEHSQTFGSLTYIIYGLADRFNIGIIPTVNYTRATHGRSSSSLKFGDWTVQAQYRMTQYHPGSWIPTTSISIQQTFPTARYDKLGPHPNDGFGSGVYSTMLSLYTQTYFWMPNGRVLRTRLNVSQQFSTGTSVSGVSVYGTEAGFIGRAKPGNVFTIDAAAEYSATRNWVLATDLVYTYDANTRLTAASGTTDLGDAHSVAFAPAIEYNWSSDVGLIAGIRLFPAGRNTSASIMPVFAINYVH